MAKSRNTLYLESRRWRIDDEIAYFSKWSEALESNRAQHREEQRIWRQQHPERHKEMLRESYHRHAELRRKNARDYRASRRRDPIKYAAYLAWCRNNKNTRRKTDPNFKIRALLRGRIRQALKRGVAKAGRLCELIGCTMPELRKHIESQWRPGMSWSNNGRTNDCWQIDHIIPCSAFDLTDPEQQKRCFHYTNLQPLWKLENTIKGDRLPTKPCPQ